VIGVLFGMIPFSYIIGRIKGIDLKEIGSKNIGATNLGRTFGLPFFILGFVLDGLKGLVPVLIIRSFAYPAAIAGAGAILGHIFNPFFGFRGGKGVSTTIGAAIGLVPKSFLLSLILWVVIYFTTYIVSLASLGFAIILPLAALMIKEATALDRIFIIIIAVLVVYAHRSNIGRLLNKQEPKTIIWKKR
jgi:glycerol-3-phosphate acyltransferase PlsY